MFNINRHLPNEFRLTRITMEELEQNRRFTETMKSNPEIGEIQTAIWFLPNFTHALKGGLRTVFTLAEYLSKNWNTKNTFVIDNFYNQVVRDDLVEQLKTGFPNLKFELINFRHSDSPANLPEADVGFCTLWVTAYTLARYNKCKSKFYFMQDYEPMFYVSGSISAAIEETYRLGFYFIANTPGVASKFTQYSEWGTQFIPGVDTKLYHPETTQANKKSPFSIVYYGRPGNERNCFLTGCEALRIVKNKLGKQVSIISVGANFPVHRYGLGGIIENRGLLKTMVNVANLYRSSDLGLSLMTTPHPSYQPLEYMASGCPAVTNHNELNNWLYKDRENIILSEPIYNILAERILNTLEDWQLREKIIEGGLNTVASLKWDTALQHIAAYISEPEKYRAIEALPEYV